MNKLPEHLLIEDLPQYSEREVLNILCNSPIFKGRIFIKSQWQTKPLLLESFYTESAIVSSNRKDTSTRGFYFYGSDTVGLLFRKYYNNLYIKDYLGRYRNIIHLDNNNAKKNVYTILINSENPYTFDDITKDPNIEPMALMPVNKLLPGDIYQEGEGDPLEHITNIVHLPTCTRLFTINYTTLERGVITLDPNQEAQTLTLVPIGRE